MRADARQQWTLPGAGGKKKRGRGWIERWKEMELNREGGNNVNGGEPWKKRCDTRSMDLTCEGPDWNI